MYRKLLHRSAIVVTALVSSTSLSAQAQRLTGKWTGKIVYDSITIPFPCEWSGEKTAPALSLFNGSDRITSTRTTWQGDSIIVDFEHLGTQLRAVVLGDSLSGVYGAPRRSGARPVVAHRTRSAARAEKGAPDIHGVWFLPTQSSKGEKAWRLVVQQHGGSVTATILRVDGDAGALTGQWRDGRFSLSHFDGARPAQLDLTPASDGSLEVHLRGPRGAGTHFIGLRPEVSRARGLAEPADFATHTRVKDPDERFQFAFPDLKGRIVADSDARFAGKVVLVNLGGSWCPNCHDEAPYLVELYQKYHGRGLEIVTLDFEERDQLQDLSRLTAFIKRYGIEYTVLVAGVPGEVNTKVPQAVNLNTWPATFFLGRDGTVRAVRTGFAAKASGELHRQLEKEYTGIIEGLLAQR